MKTKQKNKWWKLRKEDFCEDFRREARTVLGHIEEFLNDWGTTAIVIRETGRKVLVMSSGQTKEDKATYWWNSEVHKSVHRKSLAKKRWNSERPEENILEYKERTKQVKWEVAKAKHKTYEELYDRLDTKDGEKRFVHIGKAE